MQLPPWWIYLRVPVNYRLVWPSILFFQTLVILTLYIILPGRVGQTMSPFQPDSIMSFCVAAQFLEDTDSYFTKLRQAISYFELDPTMLQGNSCAYPVIETYKTRLFLPALIAAWSLVGPWWFLLMPSILIFFAIGKVYSSILICNQPVTRQKLLFALLPFVSPHVALHLSSVLSEGPSMLMILFLLWACRLTRRLSSRDYLVVVISSVFAVASRQVWPIITALCFIIAWNAFKRYRNSLKWLLIALPLLPVMVSVILSRVADLFVTYESDESLTDFVFLSDPWGALEGVSRAFIVNTSHAISFFDLPFLVLLLSIVPIVRRASWDELVLLFAVFSWGIITTATVFLVYGGLGTNWRFFVYLFVLIPIIWRERTSFSYP